MKIAFISTILPRECGIATFNDDLMDAMFQSKSGQKHEGIAIAMNNQYGNYTYPDYVKLGISQKNKDDYLKAADYLNNNADICILQHEYNIFGDKDGEMILALLRKLNIPLIVILHTVFHDPSENQKRIIKEICFWAQKVIVLSKTASKFGRSVYNIPKSKLMTIIHGIPEIKMSAKEAREKLELPQKHKIITTFGLLTRNKGVEIVLNALPEVIEKHPDTTFMVLGKTHPAIKRLYGEKYRNALEKLTLDLNIQNHVHFKNEFISDSELNSYLAATDILITSYRNKEQVSSGPLAFAMGSHTAVVSTPYWNAQELLAHGRGKLFGFNDSGRLEEILIDLLDHPEKLEELKTKAYEFGKEITWPKTGLKFIRLTESLVK